jgi:uncharacterized protein involved in exopolysaccharide biosynthesis
MPESKLSADVVNRIVESLDAYVRTKRKSYATNQRFYLEMRVQQVRDSLILSEEAFKIFRQNNRAVSESPQLILEQARLTRNTELLQAVYLELSRQLELVKIDEIRDTPVLNVEEYAKDPIAPSSTGRKILLIAIMFISMILSALYLLFEEKTKITITNIIDIVQGKS